LSYQFDSNVPLRAGSVAVRLPWIYLFAGTQQLQNPPVGVEFSGHSDEQFRRQIPAMSIATRSHIFSPSDALRRLQNPPDSRFR